MSDDHWLSAERQHELAMEELADKRREADRRHAREIATERTRRVGYLAFALTVASIVMSVAYFVWQGASTSAQARMELEMACIERGGSWTTLGASKTAKSCYQIGTIQEDPS